MDELEQRLNDYLAATPEQIEHDWEQAEEFELEFRQMAKELFLYMDSPHPAIHNKAMLTCNAVMFVLIGIQQRRKERSSKLDLEPPQSKLLVSITIPMTNSTQEDPG